MSINSNKHYQFQNSRTSTYNLDLSMDMSATNLLSDRSFMKMETKFISHLNAKYITGPNQQASIPSSPKLPGPKNNVKKSNYGEKINFEESKVKLEEKEKPRSEKRIEKTEKTEHKHKKNRNHHNLKIEIEKNSRDMEAVESPRKKQHKEENEKPAGLVRSMTMSPRKSAFKPRYSDESPRKKFRVKFNKKDQVFKVENFKDELKKIKLMSDY